MQTFWLFIHMLGVSIGAGTGIYILAVARFTEKNLDQAEAKTLLPGIKNAITTVGKVGLVLLLISGVMMAYNMGIEGLSPAFWWKMILLAALIIYLIAMEMMVKKMNATNERQIAMLMKNLGPAGPLLGVGIVLAAVLAFN